MCGRYTIEYSLVEIYTSFGLEIKVAEDQPPTYNAAPSQKLPIITAQGKTQLLPWGLTYHQNFMINKRSESRYIPNLWERCLVPASGYYEWRSENGQRQPYHFKLLGRKGLMFAGLFIPNKGFTILTIAASDQALVYHPRMPLILSTTQNLTDYLTTAIFPPHAPLLEIARVSTFVNNVRNNSPECLKLNKTEQLSIFH